MHFLKTIRFKVWINVFFRFKVLLFQTQGFKAFRDSILDDQENVPYFLHPKFLRQEQEVKPRINL